MGVSPKIIAFAFLVIAVVSVGASNARPNYLTPEDFARADRLAPLDLNATFNPPHHPVDMPKFDTQNAWKHGQWPNGRIPYVLDPTFDEAQRAEVAKAIDNYHRRTCVRFEPKQANENDYVEILRDDTACGVAHVCKQGGAQFAKFGGSCISSGVMTHELGHTLCFGHEQTRPDRDEYIDWDTSKCTPHGKDSGNDWSTLDLLYDYVSLQHYEGECYNGCILPKVKNVQKCGSGGDLSVLDVEKINAFYNCQGCKSYRYRPIANLSLNENLVVGGNGINGEPLYICRVYHEGDIITGKGDPSVPSCNIGWDGKEFQYKSNFEILTNPLNANVKWIHSPADGSLPPNAIAGGRSNLREPLYIGRCTLKLSDGRMSTIPGKIHRSASPDLYVPLGGQEHKCNDFEILVCE